MFYAMVYNVAYTCLEDAISEFCLMSLPLLSKSSAHCDKSNVVTALGLRACMCWQAPISTTGHEKLNEPFQLFLKDAAVPKQFQLIMQVAALHILRNYIVDGCY